MGEKKTGILSSKIFNSKIKSANVQRSEKWLGYFIAPAIIISMFYMSGQSYLNVFYTDVLKLTPIAGGLFLTLLPIISKILDAITNVIMGQIIERTQSRRGKGRPWILLSGPLLAISGILLFTVPNGSTAVQVVWVMISYNVYFSIAFTMYNISHTLMVPLSTRNSKQRDVLAMFSSMGQNMVPGMIVSMLFPMIILPIIGVDQGKWITVMAVISILALPAVMMEYYFTRERVTEEIADSKSEQKSNSLGEQLKACMSSKYWVVIMGIMIVYNLYNNFQVTSILYYSNWVLGTYNDGSTLTILNAVGQAPLGLGVFLLWPLVKKIGKRNVMIGGFVIGIVGCVISILNPYNMGIVLLGLTLKSIGVLPITYTIMAMLSDSLDHVEWKNGFRCDGFSSAIYSIIITVTVGISTGLFNLGLQLKGYIPPATDGSLVTQSASVQNYFIIGLFLVPAIGFFLIAFLLGFYHIEKELPQIQSDIVARHRAEAEAHGDIYFSPAEKAQLEQDELDRIADQKRVEELKNKCAKKGLKYEEEEKKYQDKILATRSKKK